MYDFAGGPSVSARHPGKLVLPFLSICIYRSLISSQQVALTSRNAGTVRTRTVGSAIYNMFCQAGSIVASNIYRKDDAPRYHTGNKVLLAILAYNVGLYVATQWWYMYRNASREKIWSKMSLEEKKMYLETTKDQGNKRLDFRFSY